jgi:hypothetical protein
MKVGQIIKTRFKKGSKSVIFGFEIKKGNLDNTSFNNHFFYYKKRT